ncbi:MAG: hypothetical protein U5S82_21120 [Gammaproteobacteria bacterium]|nr:hypothetical protein [Gammaproteobacteria bacterium]
MRQPERRVRKLTLRGGGHVQLLQARYVVEEALRTASLPGVPLHADVLVRHLDLGTLHPNLPFTVLAHKITALLRHLAAAAVCVDEQSSPDAEVVWFSDPVQVYVTLLTRLLDGKAVNEWYWRSLFPGQDLSLQPATIEWLLLASRQTALQELAPAHVLQAVVEARSWPRLLAFITPTLARRMLHGAGLSPVAAVKHNGARAYGPKAIQPAPLNADWREALRLAVETWGDADVRSQWLAWHALVLHRPAWLECRDCLQRLDLVRWMADASDGRRPVQGDDPAPHSALGKAQNTTAAADYQRSNILRSAPPDPGASAAAVQDPPSSPATGHRQYPAGVDAGRDLRPDPARHPQGRGKGAAALTRFTSQAGFAFVVPLLQRLALAELLQQDQRLIQLDFARQLLWSMARRFGIQKHDPIWSLFEDFEPQSDVALADIPIPRLWLRLSGKHVSSTSLHALINTIQLTAEAYLRRYCQLSLGSLLNRPGRVSITATHWDVHFDINQTELRLRRVALDTDPGWTPWLGRVLQFHYDHEG